MKLKCVIVDDEQLARQLLEGYVAKIPNLELVGSFKNPIDVLDLMQTETIDLLFADIQMPELLGTTLVKGLSKMPMVIFTTAYREYAVEGFELDVLDYMLKPISFERFLQGANKALDLQKLRENSAEQEPSVQISIQEKNFITLKANHRIYKVKFDDIQYIEGLSEYVTFHTSQRKIVVLESLKRLSELLPSPQFMRIHRSFMVNLDKVESLYGNQLELKNNTLPVGKSYKQGVLDHFEAK